MGLASHMPRLGVETAAVCIESWNEGDARAQHRRTEVYNGVRIHRLYSNESWEPLSTLWTGSEFYVQQFEQILDEEKPDLIHVMAHLRLARLIEMAAKRGIPVVLTGVDFSPLCGRSLFVQWNGNLCDGKAEVNRCGECIAFGRGLNPEHWNGRASKAWGAVKGFSESTRDTIYSLSRYLKRNGMARVRFYDEWGHRTATRILDHMPRLFSSLDRVFAPSPIMRQMWEKNGYPAERIVDMPYGVDIGPSHVGRDKTWSREFRFGFIGRFNGAKNLRALLEAFLLIDGKAPVSLSLYGAEDFWNHGDPEIADLKEAARLCPNIHFKGRLDRSEVPQAYESIDCLVVPSSWYENAPISMMEAQYFKTPIICTDLPGMTCLVTHEVNGLIFRHKMIRELALQMFRMATDPELYARLRDNAVSIQNMSENCVHVLDEYRKVAKGAVPAVVAPAEQHGNNGHARKPATLRRGRELSLADELTFWARELSEERVYPWHGDRLTREGRSKSFPDFLRPVFRHAGETFGGEVLHVVEIGSGPLSTLGWAVEQGLCTVTAVDPLADAYNRLLDETGVDVPIRPVKGDGERLLELLEPDSCHIAFVANALDHVEDPLRTFRNLATVVKPGGFICMTHFVDEGSHEGWEQLHQWNLRPEDDMVLLADRDGKSWRLDQRLDLELVSLKLFAEETERPQFTVIYRRPALVPATA